MRNYLTRNKPPVLGNTSRALVEFVPDVSFEEIDEAISLFESYNYLPIIAHIERYDTMFHNKIERLKQRHNCRFQVNCSTLLKSHGLMKNRTIDRWFSQHLIDYVSSDSHNTKIRPNQMLKAYEKICSKYGSDYAAKLMVDKGNGSL